MAMAELIASIVKVWRSIEEERQYHSLFKWVNYKFPYLIFLILTPPAAQINNYISSGPH